MLAIVLLFVISCLSEGVYLIGDRRLLTMTDNCSQVVGVDPNNLLESSNPLATVGIVGTSYSVSYSVTDAVRALQATESPNQACHINVAQIINKAGVAVSAGAAGAQASVRATNFNDPKQQQCAGAILLRVNQYILD